MGRAIARYRRARSRRKRRAVIAMTPNSLMVAEAIRRYSSGPPPPITRGDRVWNTDSIPSHKARSAMEMRL